MIFEWLPALVNPVRPRPNPMLMQPLLPVLPVLPVGVLTRLGWLLEADARRPAWYPGTVLMLLAGE